MNINALRNINLNKLPILWELLRCRNVSIAAYNLSLTQSTVSAALKYLREFFDDELLVQSGRELILTERAQEIIPLLEASLNILGDLVREPTFDPTSAEGVFRVATADYVSVLLLPHLVRKLQSEAPCLTVQMVPASMKVTNELKLGLVDIAIGPEQFLDWIGARGQEDSLHFERCFVEPLVCIERAGRGDADMDVETYLRRPHATIHMNRGLPANIELDTLMSLRMNQHNRVLIPHFSLLPLIIAETDMISLIPKSLALYYRNFYDISIFEPPITFPPIALNLLWLGGRKKDKSFQWFLDAVRSSFRELEKTAA